MRVLRHLGLLTALALALSGCAGGTSQDLDGGPSDALPPNDASPPDDGSTPPPPLSPLAATRAVEDDAFVTAPICAECHSNAPGSDAMRDEASRPIAPFDLWRSSMMASSARDPLWRAVMSAEIATTPSRKADIEAKCFSCHAPMATRAGLEDGQLPSLEMVYTNTDRSQILLDGVSCAVCHQITSEDLGEDASYSGNFVLNDEREIYGPHGNPFGMPMARATGYTPGYAEHMTESALCGTCHTLFTNTLDPDGNPTGDHFAEQTPYLEWRNSAFNDELPSPLLEAASCRDCHVPITSVDGVGIHTEIARLGRALSPRSPFGRHVFVGANTLIPAILRDNAADLRPNASATELDATIAAAREQLQERTATIELVSASRDGDRITMRLRLQNLAGHKLPTGFPSRRAWVRVQVVDDGGQNVFSSGVTNAMGQLVDSRGEVLTSEAAGGPVQPHRDLIDEDDQVLILEDVMADVHGAPTFTLLRAATHLKDNRLLPKGWNPNHPDAEHTRVYGEAATDASFVDGADVITYAFVAPKDHGPYRIQAAFLYQTVSPRFAAELFTHSTSEVEAFARYYAPIGSPPETMASLEIPFD